VAVSLRFTMLLASVDRWCQQDLFLWLRILGKLPLRTSPCALHWFTDHQALEPAGPGARLLPGYTLFQRIGGQCAEENEPPASWDPPAQEHLQRRRKDAWGQLPRIFVQDGSDNFHGNSSRVGWQKVCWTCYPDSITKVCSMLSCVHLHQIMNASLTCSVEYVCHHAHTRTTHTHRMVSCVVNDTKVWINH